MAMVRIQVNLRNTATSEQVQSVFEFSFQPDALVRDVKEQIAAAQQSGVAFPNQHLRFKGQQLKEDDQLNDVGIADRSSLDFILQSDESAIVQQLTELLQARDLTTDELGLMYCYKFGISVNQALRNVGIDQQKLLDFINEQPEFILEGGRVFLKREKETGRPISVTNEIVKLVQEHGPFVDITKLSVSFIHKFGSSISSLTGSPSTLAYLADRLDTFVVNETGNVSLRDTTGQIVEPPKAAGAGARLFEPDFVTRAVKPKAPLYPPIDIGRKSIEKTNETPQVVVPKRKPPAPKTEDKVFSGSMSVAVPGDGTNFCMQTRHSDETYHDLHTKISSRSFNSRIAQLVNTIIDGVKENTFLSIHSVAKCGSVGKGTAITGSAVADIVFFINGLPREKHQKWLPPLLRGVQHSLEQNLQAEELEEIKVLSTSVQLRTSLLEANLMFSPVFESHQETLEALAEANPQQRKFLLPALLKDSSQYVSKQKGQVKVTIRLLKWWRDQQQWSGPLARPSDYMLELIAVHSAQQSKPKDQPQAIGNCMALFAQFEELRITFSNFYKRADISAHLLQQKPLLMDPVNPFDNMVSPETFESRELMALASSTHFFW